MSIWIWLLIAYLAWTISGFIYFIMNLGRKTGPDTLMDYVMMVPVFVIAPIFGLIHQIQRKHWK